MLIAQNHLLEEDSIKSLELTTFLPIPTNRNPDGHWFDVLIDRQLLFHGIHLVECQ